MSIKDKINFMYQKKLEAQLTYHICASYQVAKKLGYNYSLDDYLILMSNTLMYEQETIQAIMKEYMEKKKGA